MTGIYKIESKINPSRIYVGSALNIQLRWIDHLSKLRRNKHHSLKLQRHYNKYGVDDLNFSIILFCNKEVLIINEQIYIDLLTPYFNCCKIAGNTLGFKQTKETKKKLSEISRGKNNPMFGKHFSEESKQKMRVSKIGKKHTKDHNEKIRLAGMNRSHSEETKRKIGAKNKGKILSLETRKRISDSRKKLFKKSA